MYVSSCQSVDLRIDIVKYEEGHLNPGGTWVFFGWVCATRDSKLATRSKKIPPIPRSRVRPKTEEGRPCLPKYWSKDNIFPTVKSALLFCLILKLIPRSRNGPIFYTLFL